MSLFVTSTTAPEAKTRNSMVIGLMLAVFFILMLVAQLFTYEDFPAVLSGMWLPGGSKAATILAAVIVIVELFSLPFFLRMRVSLLMRFVSMIMGWLVVSMWLFITIWQNTTVNAIGNAGVLGATVRVPTGWWTTLIFIALGTLVAWASWGMWPRASSNK